MSETTSPIAPIMVLGVMCLHHRESPSPADQSWIGRGPVFDVHVSCDDGYTIGWCVTAMATGILVRGYSLDSLAAAEAACEAAAAAQVALLIRVRRTAP